MENAINDTGVAIFDLIAQSDVVVKMIILILIAASIWSWTIIFDKIIKFRQFSSENQQFQKLFWSGVILNDLYQKIKNTASNSSAMIFVAAMKELENSNIDLISKGSVSSKTFLKERLENVMHVALSRSMEKLREGLPFLGIVASTATFFGLFGTVWGITHSFQAIASSQDTSLAVIAPGVAGALLTTIIGLFTAIPAVIFYNLYKNKILKLYEQSENFMYELLTILSRELD